MENSKVMSISAIMGKYRSKRHFFEAYNSQGFILIDERFISWNYIAEILTGKKLLISQEMIKDFWLPPRRDHQTQIDEREGHVELLKN